MVDLGDGLEAIVNDFVVTHHDREGAVEISQNLSETELDDEIRSLRDQLGWSIDEWSEISEQVRRQTGRLF